MAIETHYLVKAHVEGTTRKVFAKQVDDVELVPSSIPGSWVPVGMELDGGTIFGVDLTTIFEVTDGGATGTLTLNLLNLQSVGGGAFNTIVDAFTNGGVLTFAIDLGPGGLEPVTVHLRALKSTDYMLNGAQAQAGIPPGVVGENFAVPGSDALGNYTFEFSNDFAAPAYTLTSTGVGGSDVMLNAAGEAPRPRADPTDPTAETTNAAQIRVTRTYGALSQSSVLAGAIHVPTELTLLLDRSGSMNATATSAGVSKWAAASSVSNLFSVLFQQLIPDRRTTGDVTFASRYGIKFASFSSTGSPEVATFDPATAGDFDPVTPAPTAPVLTPAGGTPIGEALVESAAQFNVANKWARRLILLLTDGQSNTGTPPLASLSTTDLVPLSSSPENGIILHALSYAKSLETDASGLAALAGVRDGDYQATTGTDFDDLSLDALLSAYLPFLQHVLPAEYDSYTTAMGAKGQPAEPGLDRLVLVTRHTPAAGTLVAATNPSGTPVAAGATHGDVSGFRWATIENPEPGVEYGFVIQNGGLSALPDNVEIYEFYDLSVRSQFGIDASDAGKPARLWAKLTYNGIPVEGAQVRAAVGSPEESTGSLMTRFVRSAAYPRAIRQKAINPQALYASLIATNLSLQKLKRVSFSASAPAQPLSHANFNVAATTGTIAVSTQGGVDLQSVGGQLLRGLEAERGLDFQYDRYPIELVDKGNGLYEYTLSSEQTQNAGVYTVKFQADGQASGYSFSRKIQRTKVIDEAPSQGDSLVSVQKDPVQPNAWNINIFPVSVQGKPMGPGLAHVASFQYVDKAARNDPKLPQLVTQDNLDGSYSTKVEVPDGKLPEVALFFGNPDAGAPAVVARPSAKIRKVKVILEKIQVLDDKDPCLKGKGELTFATSVAPNGSPARSIRTLLPESGHLELSSGDTVETNEIIFEGYVEEGADLVIAMTGTELDWPSCLDPNDQLTRYIRRIPVPAKTTKYTPDDEKNDPESLADWKVWYTVEVS